MGVFATYRRAEIFRGGNLPASLKRARDTPRPAGHGPIFPGGKPSGLIEALFVSDDQEELLFFRGGNLPASLKRE